MDISARAISLPDRPRMGHLGHQCSHAPGRPILHLISSSRRPRREQVKGYVINLSLNRVQFLCLCRAVVPSSRPALVLRRRAQGDVKAGRRAWLASSSGVARPRLDGAEHGARIKQVGRLHHWSSSFRTGVLWPAPPRRCGRACWRARSPARCGAVASWPPRSTTSAHSAPSLLA